MNIKSICKAVFFSGIIALSLFLLAGSVGAAPFEEWNRTFRGAGNASAYSVQETADGGYLISGSTCSSYEQCSPWLLKTDADGNEQWNMTFGEAQNSEAYSVRQTKDGSYIIAGTTFPSAGGNYAWLRKVSGEQTGPAKTQASSPTVKTSPAVTPTPSPTRTMTVIPTENHTEKPLEKVLGFEAVLAISTFLAVHIAGRRGW
ncbi:MAG: hypothetical protein OIN66_04875 [Candidatus Methanoperedens sp.]|nr:hypothetical protein [Candidatus Methanoperedens sp.]